MIKALPSNQCTSGKKYITLKERVWGWEPHAGLISAKIPRKRRKQGHTGDPEGLSGRLVQVGRVLWQQGGRDGSGSLEAGGRGALCITQGAGDTGQLFPASCHRPPQR